MAQLPKKPDEIYRVVSLYHESEMNLRETGSTIGVTESRGSQLFNQAHVRLSVRIEKWKKRKKSRLTTGLC